jgi:imidazolonepropionase-like amidohydrolase
MKRTSAFATALALIFAAASAQAKDVVIHAGTLIDGTGGAPRRQVSIVVHDERISAVQAGFVTPPGAEIIDLSQQTVLPGLIDCHVHIMAAWHGGDPIRLAVTTTAYDALIDGVNDARATLLAGFTTIRDVGDATAAVVALKKAVAAGTIPGPRMWVSGAALGPSGGHGDPANGLLPEFGEIPSWHESLVDSPEQARTTVRRMWRGPHQDHAFGRCHVDRRRSQAAIDAGR